jgi:hypothetical protein
VIVLGKLNVERRRARGKKLEKVKWKDGKRSEGRGDTSEVKEERKTHP